MKKNFLISFQCCKENVQFYLFIYFNTQKYRKINKQTKKNDIKQELIMWSPINCTQKANVKKFVMKAFY